MDANIECKMGENNKDWFETWFDSPYYHLLYNHRNEQEATDFIHLLFSRLPVSADAKVLDVACGKGRHARTIATLGYDTTGVDLSPNSIAFAKQFETEKLHFAVSDMRLVFQPNHYDVVTNLFSSFGYFDEDAENEKAFLAISENIKKNGLLVIDYMNPEAIIKNMKSREIIAKDDIHFHITKKIENGFIKKQIRFLANNEDCFFEEKLKIIKPETFASYCEKAGLIILQKYGDYQLSPFQSNNSNRQIIIAQKK